MRHDRLVRLNGPEECHKPATESKKSRAEVELIRKGGFVSREKAQKAL
jgi:hypothetical protein